MNTFPPEFKDILSKVEVVWLQVVHVTLQLPLTYFGWDIGYPLKIYRELSHSVHANVTRLSQTEADQFFCFLSDSFFTNNP
jgi:hypothetical protein